MGMQQIGLLRHGEAEIVCRADGWPAFGTWQGKQLVCGIVEVTAIL